jgi:hypothetical protein
MIPLVIDNVMTPGQGECVGGSPHTNPKRCFSVEPEA